MKTWPKMFDLALGFGFKVKELNVWRLSVNDN